MTPIQKKVVKAQGEEKPWKGTLFIVQICTLCQKPNWGTNQVFLLRLNMDGPVTAGRWFITVSKVTVSCATKKIYLTNS